jgi:hypothetical protein
MITAMMPISQEYGDSVNSSKQYSRKARVPISHKMPRGLEMAEPTP